jgi:glycerate kinase
MTGAAGGLAGGLWACFGAELTPGVEAVLGLLSVHDRLTKVDLVVSGEGRLDRQTAHGKVIAGVVAMGAGAGLPVHAVVGSTELTPAEGVQLGLASVQVASSADEIVDAGARILALSRPS